MNPLRRRLLDAGMTPEELADRLSGHKPKVSARTIRRWSFEGITAWVSPGMAKVVADHFDIPASQLIEELQQWAADQQDKAAA